MAIPGTPLWVLLALLFLVSLCAPPFESARSALMADVLEGDRYAVATSLTNITLQLAQVVGFLAAGVLVAALSPSAALFIDGVTFAISALWLARGLQRRPAPTAEAGDGPRSLWQDIGDGLRLIARSPRLLAIMGVLWVATMFATASEGVAAPLVEQLGQPGHRHRHPAGRASARGDRRRPGDRPAGGAGPAGEARRPARRPVAGAGARGRAGGRPGRTPANSPSRSSWACCSCPAWARPG